MLVFHNAHGVPRDHDHVSLWLLLREPRAGILGLMCSSDLSTLKLFLILFMSLPFFPIQGPPAQSLTLLSLSPPAQNQPLFTCSVPLVVTTSLGLLLAPQSFS